MKLEDVVRRIAAECSYIDQRGAVGIRLKPAADIVREYGGQCRRTTLPRPYLRADWPEPASPGNRRFYCQRPVHIPNLPNHASREADSSFRFTKLDIDPF